MLLLLPSNGPDPNQRHPLPQLPQICFINNTVTNPQRSIGDCAYYDDPENSEDFERNVLYHFPFIGDRLIGDRLIIDGFCAIPRNVRFIINGVNHQMKEFSTYLYLWPQLGAG